MPALQAPTATVPGLRTTAESSGSFLGIGAGPFMSIEPDATTAVELLGWRIVGPADRGTNVLDEIGGSGNGATGFSGPLRAGDYTVWTQALATRSFAYRYNFVLSAGPEPAAGALFGLGLLALRTIRRRRPPAAVTPIQSSE